MKFEKDSRERKMFGSLNSMVKKYFTMEKIDYFELYLECSRFGSEYEVQSEVEEERNFAHALAFEFMKYVIHNKKDRVFSFSKDSKEYNMCLAFYRLAQRFWVPCREITDEEKEYSEEFWRVAIEEVSAFYKEFSFVEDEEKGLAFLWGSLLLERLDAMDNKKEECKI